MGRRNNDGKLAYRARHRLQSIHRDSKNLKQRVLSSLAPAECNEYSFGSDAASHWPWLPNKKCGSWYLPPDQFSSIEADVYFKSTDGHVGTYAFSLKRLNVSLLEVLHEHGGCFLVDSSVRKVLPDSFSRTIPIWCSVMNRIVLKYRAELGMPSSGDNSTWDTQLYTPSSIVSPEEHADISALIDSRVEL